MARWRSSAFAAIVVMATASCGPAGEGGENRIDDGMREEVETVLAESIRRITERTAAIEDSLRPVPFLTGAQESELRRYLNAGQLALARRLGIERRPDNQAEIEALVESGALVELEDSTEYWMVRELDHSVAYVTSDAKALLTEIGERFQAKLAELGLPPYRLDITSVLRTSENQAELREINPNAAAGVSTHEFGTTVDIAYSSYPAPAESIAELDTGGVSWLMPYLQNFSAAMAESVSARKSRELQAILGGVLQEMQEEGKVMVTLERGQPVFHMTVAQDY